MHASQHTPAWLTYIKPPTHMRNSYLIYSCDIYKHHVIYTTHFIHYCTHVRVYKIHVTYTTHVIFYSDTYTTHFIYSRSHLGWHVRKLKAQSSNVSFTTFQWKETFELWALSSETAFENVTPSGIGCTIVSHTQMMSYKIVYTNLPHIYATHIMYYCDTFTSYVTYYRSYQCVAACCSVLQCVAVWHIHILCHILSCHILDSWRIHMSYTIVTYTREVGGWGRDPKKMYGERLGDGVEYHLMSPTPRR